MSSKQSRGRKAAINTFASLAEEVTSVICGFILPRLILSAFGSKYNGLITSISQFLGCAVLLRSGIGGATRAALYKPLANKDKDEFNSIVNATDIFMKKIGIILMMAIFVFAMIYPLLVENEFGWLFTFSLFLIIGASTFAESFFGITYLIVLQADQRLWVTSVMKIACCILNTVIGAILIINGFSIHVVKLGSAAIYVLYPILLGLDVRKYYHIDKKVQPNTKAISQRWDAFWLQVSVFVMNNTDIMVLTLFSNMMEVSVYSIYNMIVMGLKRTILSFSNGLEAAFGNMIAKKEQKILDENVAVIEFIMYSVSTIFYTCAAVLILDFVGIYTKGIIDVNYIRPVFAYTIILAQFFNAIRIPYQLVVQAAGHYKQTKNGAIIEPIINITISVLFVLKFGLVGVAVGTLAATIFRTIQYSVYMGKNIVPRKIDSVIKRIIVSFLEAAIVIAIINILPFGEIDNYVAWAGKGVITFSLCAATVLGGGFVFYKNELAKTLQKLHLFNRR